MSEETIIERTARLLREQGTTPEAVQAWKDRASLAKWGEKMAEHAEKMRREFNRKASR